MGSVQRAVPRASNRASCQLSNLLVSMTTVASSLDLFPWLTIIPFQGVIDYFKEKLKTDVIPKKPKITSSLICVQHINKTGLYFHLLLHGTLYQKMNFCIFHPRKSTQSSQSNTPFHLKKYFTKLLEFFFL
jgi:hypothetical protein